MCVLRRQFFSMPMQKCRRTGSKVNRDVPYLPLNAAYQLHFGMRVMLKMQSTDRADGSCRGLINLYNLSRTNEFAKFVLAVKPGEEPALISLGR